jgi:hypothetical protein
MVWLPPRRCDTPIGDLLTQGDNGPSEMRGNEEKEGNKIMIMRTVAVTVVITESQNSKKKEDKNKQIKRKNESPKTASKFQLFEMQCLNKSH